MKHYIFIAITLFLFSCGTENKEGSNSRKSKKEATSTNDESDKEKEEEVVFEAVDFDMDITKLSLSEVRILRNSFFAKQGYCFMKADLRGYFSTTTDWYDKKMEDRWWAEDGGEKIEPISFTPKEKAFIEKLKQREEELKQDNFTIQNNKILANLDNVVNLFQLEEINPNLMDMLGKNGFAIVPNDNIQLFHVYEQNDYQQFPNFVTTDMYMQLFHMYFGFVLRTIEEDKFVELLSEICQSMMKDMNAIASSDIDISIKNIANYNATYYAIAYTVLTGEKVDVPSEFKTLYKEELEHIQQAKNTTSTFLDYTEVLFPYSLYKPRGHYTRNDSLKRYFKAMMWLQTAPFCLDNDSHLKRAIMSASVLTKNQRLMNIYRELLEPINFIIGEADNVSFLDLSKLFKKGGHSLLELLSNETKFGSFRAEVKKIADAKNKIKPKSPKSCVDKMNFIPQRYLADNEILQELVDLESNISKRAYPKGLDVMATFGSSSAESILLKELQEGNNWEKYPDKLEELKGKMKDVSWDATLYNKWIETLLELQKPNDDYPYFMQNTQWQKKDLNASLASWAELKHDAILYAEQPMAAECGGGGPPDPYTVGYVEPNVKYWNAVIELIDLTQTILEKNNLMTNRITGVTTKLRENAQFLLSASKKELAGQKLSEQEYRQIEYIGSTFEWITIDLVKQKDQHLDGWHNVKGPDRSVAVVADVYTANSENNPDKGILHVATGNVNDIFVLVEIEGYLYITKGAVLSYYEFPLPMGNRLTDEEWQDMINKNQAPHQPDWIKEIILPIKSPKSNEKIFYSSGC